MLGGGIFAREKGGVLLPELRNQWGGFFLGRGESYAAGLCLGGLFAGQAQGYSGRRLPPDGRLRAGAREKLNRGPHPMLWG